MIGRDDRTDDNASRETASMSRDNVETVECDFLVVGSGAAGLSGALFGSLAGLDTILIEKTGLLGGTTATSGGVVWVPGNPAAQASSGGDDLAKAEDYLADLTGRPSDPVRTAYHQAIGEAVDLLSQHSLLRLVPISDYPDYHSDIEGAGVGRAMTPLPFDGRKLPVARFEQIRPPRRDTMLFGKIMLDRADLAHLLRPWASVRSMWRSIALLAKYVRDRLRRSRGAQLRSGNALVARLVHSLDDRGVPLLLNTEIKELITEGGRVIGAVVNRNGVVQRILCRRGVLLAAGGSAANSTIRDQIAGPGCIPLSLVPEANTGDTLEIAQAVGAKLDSDMKSGFFLFPGSEFKSGDGSKVAWPHFTFADRAKPGLIAIDENGERFVNEASSYQVVADKMLEVYAERPDARFFLLCDRKFIFRYGVGVVRPFALGLRRHIKSGYVKTGSNPADLAAKLGCDATRLTETLNTYNRGVASGKDAFGKGANLYNTYNGDPQCKPNPCLAPISVTDLCAIQVWPAAAGSAVGLAANADAQVLNGSDGAIDGLYVAGNDMASVMRGTYPGPGITIGPAIAFAYRAVMHAAKATTTPQ